MPGRKESADALPVQLPADIVGLEKRIVANQRALRRHAVSFGQKMRSRITSPGMLAGAVGVGIVLGMLSLRVSSESCIRTAAGPWTRRLVDRLLKIVALFRGLMPALRIIPARMSE